jgi:hypothetical protein
MSGQTNHYSAPNIQATSSLETFITKKNTFSKIIMFNFFKLTSHALQAVTIIQGKVNRPDHDQQR